MKYTARIIEENVNISQTSQLTELFTLLVGSAGIICLIYAISGFFIETTVMVLPNNIKSKIESKLVSEHFEFLNKINTEQFNNRQIKLQKMLNSLLKETNIENPEHYQIKIIDNPDINAFAVPGGKIYITSGLLKEVSSDDELIFVIAHELGHFIHKDHLKMLGRRIILIGLSTVFFGDKNSATTYLLNSAEITEMKFSQKQEIEADLWAASQLHKQHYQISKALKFFKRLEAKDKEGELAYFFETHPHPEDRITAIVRQMHKENINISKE